MNIKFKFLLILLSSGFLLYFINTTLFPVSEKQNSKVSQYWFQQAYFRNEIYLYLDKMKEQNLLQKLKIHSKDFKTKNNINTIEYLNMYNEYIAQMQQLSRMILELNRNAQFIMDDIVFILKNLNIDDLSKNDSILIKEMNKSIKQLILIRDKIEKQNKEINDLRVTIKQQSVQSNSKINQLSNEKDKTKKLVDSVMAEIPLVILIGKIKYNSKFGLKKPDYLLEPIRNYGEEIIALNKKYEKLLIIYNKQISQQQIVNHIANYLVYLLFIGLLLYEVKASHRLGND